METAARNGTPPGNPQNFGKYATVCAANPVFKSIPFAIQLFVSYGKFAMGYACHLGT